MKNKVHLKRHTADTVSLFWIILWCTCINVAQAESSDENARSSSEVKKSSAEEMLPSTNRAEYLTDLCKQVECTDKVRTDQKASYALGVSFYRTIGSNFDMLDYALFLKGVIDASDKKVTVDDEKLKEDLTTVVISEEDKSVMFLKGLNESTEIDVLEIDGVYVEKRPDLPEDLLEDWEDNASCRRNLNTDSSDMYRVSYARLVLDHTSKTLWPGVSNDKNKVQNGRSAVSRNVMGCINIHEREMIRGWRTVLNEMTPGDKWAVAIPPALAYGSSGVKDLVEKDVALYFILELNERPQSIFQRLGMR